MQDEYTKPHPEAQDDGCKRQRVVANHPYSVELNLPLSDGTVRPVCAIEPDDGQAGSYLQAGMEFRVSRQRPNTALWDVEEVGTIWYFGIFQDAVAYTLDAATAATVQETGSVPFDDDHVHYVAISPTSALALVVGNAHPGTLPLSCSRSSSVPGNGGSRVKKNHCPCIQRLRQR